MTKNFGDWQWEPSMAMQVHGITSRFPFDFESIERKALLTRCLIGCTGMSRPRAGDGSHAARKYRCVLALRHHSANDG